MSHSEKKPAADCPVCLESFTPSVRARVSCPQCTCDREFLIKYL